MVTASTLNKPKISDHLDKLSSFAKTEHNREITKKIFESILSKYRNNEYLVAGMIEHMDVTRIRFFRIGHHTPTPKVLIRIFNRFPFIEDLINQLELRPVDKEKLNNQLIQLAITDRKPAPLKRFKSPFVFPLEEFEDKTHPDYWIFDLVRAVEDKFNSSDLTEKDLYASFGITESDWYAYLAEEKHPDLNFYTGVMKTFPALIPFCIVAMTGKDEYFDYIFI
jgi:hypothetical protein